jgi:3,4-dihydroxyphenylacetate 2,3-dioxygenase
MAHKGFARRAGAGTICAAALVSHSPSMMLSEARRRLMGGGVDSTLPRGLERLRSLLDEACPDTLVIIDTHWMTTLQFVVDGRSFVRGTYTSDELPQVVRDLAYDYIGAPNLARRIETDARERGVACLSETNANLALHYGTLNLLRYLLKRERVLAVSICQTAQAHNFIAFGDALASAIADVPGRVALLASGGMSHRFWPMDQMPDHLRFDASHLRDARARQFDERILEWWRRGDHQAVVDEYPDYMEFAPEGLFGHYLTLLGALGGRDCTAKGTLLSEYENALGTGQVHVWFEAC